MGEDEALDKFMTEGWAHAAPLNEPAHPAAALMALRRKRLAAKFRGKTLVIPTGIPKVRNNDCDFRFRPGSDFYWLTGGTDPHGVLVLRPTRWGHTATLYVAPRSDQTTSKFFRDMHYGEMWVGPRRGLGETEAFLQIPTASLEGLDSDLKALDPANTLVLRGFDPAVDAAIAPHARDGELAEAAAELRLIKDSFEIKCLRRAIDATARGFNDVVSSLPSALSSTERYVEGVFNLRARLEGNDVGYDTIVGSGPHATTLHWTRNDGKIKAGDLLLLDAGVEDNELYSADVTRTVPVSGRFSPAQREIYDIVLAAQKAGIAAAKPGADFLAPHLAARGVIAAGLRRLGIPSVAPDPELSEAKVAFRYMPHGTSHMLGLDVHDCDAARQQIYSGKLRPGHVLTVEPGLYFKTDDLWVPEKYRGIGVRIEDDILITKTGNVVLSASIPRDVDAVEHWMKQVQQSRPVVAIEGPSVG